MPTDPLYEARFQIMSINWLRTVEFVVAAVKDSHADATVSLRYGCKRTGQELT